MKPKMFYFGPWERAGHFLWREDGYRASWQEEQALPWAHGIDGVLQPGCRQDPRDGRWNHRGAAEVQGEALVHHKDGWTALSFWDRSVDTRGACNSTYFAEGTFTFEEIVEMARTRFAERWDKMNFTVRPAPVMEEK